MAQMVVYFFRWRVRADREDDFRSSWAEVTRALRAEGSDGSALFRARDGTWCGIARWPDAACRERAMAAVDLTAQRNIMQASTEEVVEMLELTEELNLWAPYP
jgi:hypothetical protein